MSSLISSPSDFIKEKDTSVMIYSRQPTGHPGMLMMGPVLLYDISDKNYYLYDDVNKKWFKIPEVKWSDKK